MTTGSAYHHGSKLLWAACLSLQLAACSATAHPSAPISQQALAAQIEAGTAPLILDVRTAAEYETGHIPGAVNIPFQEIEARIDEIAQDGPIVVYCERGVRANIAEKTLQDAGIDSILHLEGDISQWRQRQLPLESGDSSLGYDVRNYAGSI